MYWPKSLITELASRRCIIFIGSGASAGCESQDGLKKPPTWKEFLNNLIALMRDNSDVILINSLIEKEKYLDAAEIIQKNILSADFSAFIRQEFVIPRFKPSKIHEAVLQIDPKIVITTNYDEIYDTYCRSGSAAEGYNVSKYYDKHIINDLRSPVRLIVKAHGCVNNMDKIVLTRSQYFTAKQENLSFYKILDSLFLTSTILFIGYSLTDPDIQLVLENSNIAAPSSHPHYIVVGNDIHNSLKEASTRAYNIQFIEYESGNFNELNEGLIDLANEVKLNRLNNPEV